MIVVVVDIFLIPGGLALSSVVSKNTTQNKAQNLNYSTLYPRKYRTITYHISSRLGSSIFLVLGTIFCRCKKKKQFI
jgi:hypothetical protein